MVTSNDYEFVESEGTDNWIVKLKTGEWEGTSLLYGKVSLSPPAGKTWEDLEQEGVYCEPVLKYNYEIFESPFDPQSLEADDNFNNYVGDILVDIISDSFETGKYKIGSEDGSQPRNNDTAEPAE